MGFQLITANRLQDGRSVWLTAERGWDQNVSKADAIPDDQAPSLLSTLAARQQDEGIVDLHATPAGQDAAGQIEPAQHREQIRATGPSVRPDLPVRYAAQTPPPPPVISADASPYAGVYRYDAEERQFLRDRVARFSDQIARRIRGELSEEEFKPLRLMNGLYLQLHGYMLRVAVPYGVLSATQMRVFAYIARHYDRGYGHFTTRQNIQFNWPKLDDVPAILGIMAEAELHAIQTSGNCVRNTTTDQFAGAAADELVDPRVFAEILRQWSTDHPEFTYLPRKFKIAITGSPQDRAAVRVHDIGILTKRNAAGEIGFEVYAGGGLGRTPIVGTRTREWLPVPELLRYIEAVLRVYNALGNRENIYKARIKILLRDIKPAQFIEMIEAELAALPPGHGVLSEETIAAVAAGFVQPPFETLPAFTAWPQNAAFTAWRKRNTHPHKQPGYISAVISLKPKGGITGDASAEEMEIVADLADQYSFGEIRVAHEQNLILPHVQERHLFELWQKLDAACLATANIGLITDIIACPGMDYCSLATARSIPIAQRLSEHLADPARQAELGPLTLNISGCINACAHHHVANIGLLGVDKAGEEVYQVTLGGSADEQAAIGQIIGPAFSAAEVPSVIDIILNTYMAHRQAGESFIETYRRLGGGIFKEAVYARH